MSAPVDADAVWAVLAPLQMGWVRQDIDGQPITVFQMNDVLGGQGAVMVVDNHYIEINFKRFDTATYVDESLAALSRLLGGDDE